MTPQRLTEGVRQASAARETALWLHAITPDGASADTGPFTDVAFGDRDRVRVEGTSGPLMVPNVGESRTLVLSMPSNG